MKSINSNLRARIAHIKDMMPTVDCPLCEAVTAMSDEELDRSIQNILSGVVVPRSLPDPSPTCPRCRESAAISEEELDAKLIRLIQKYSNSVLSVTNAVGTSSLSGDVKPFER